MWWSMGPTQNAKEPLKTVSPPSHCKPQIHFQRHIRSSFKIAPAFLYPPRPPQICPMFYWEQFYSLLRAMLWYSINDVVFKSTCKFVSMRMSTQPETEIEDYSATAECCAGCWSIAQGCLVSAEGWAQANLTNTSPLPLGTDASRVLSIGVFTP